MNKILLALTLILSPAIFMGCQTAQPTSIEARAYLTLASVKVAADGAEKVYGNLVALGHVSQDKQEEIDGKIVELHASYLLSLRIARGNPNAASNARLQSLADDLIITINQLSK